MRHEHIVLDLSTAACAHLESLLRDDQSQGPSNAYAAHELQNLANELRARLQHLDQDPQAKLPADDWMDA